MFKYISLLLVSLVMLFGVVSTANAAHHKPVHKAKVAKCVRWSHHKCHKWVCIKNCPKKPTKPNHPSQPSNPGQPSDPGTNPPSDPGTPSNPPSGNPSNPPSNPGNPSNPPVDEPPVDNPPVDEPPVDNPPVDNPPVDNPPVDNPPVDNPPVVQPGTRPFSDSSPFNLPVTNPVILSNSATLVSTSGINNGLPSPISTDRAESVNYDHPVYYTKSTDPLATLVMSSTNKTYRVPVPNYAIPTSSSDAHICIVAPDGREYNLWNTKKTGTPGNYTFTAQIGGWLPADGLGIKTPSLVSQYGNQIDGGVEAKFSERAGMILASEMAAGQINHALFVVASGAAAGDSGAVYPGFSGPSGYKTNDRVRMGTRFWLNMSDAAIDATSAPRWEKIIAHAAHQYGIYVGDKGGAGFSFMLESSTPYNAAGVTNPWDSIMAGFGVRNSGQYGYGASFTSHAIWDNLVAIQGPPGP